jgi:undecaprenyl-diphosphatase
VSGLAVNARTVVMTLGAVLVLGCVLVRLGWHRNCSGIALSLTLGALILVGGVWHFADALVRTDPEVMRWFQAHAPPEVTSVMWAISLLGSRPVVGAMSALLAIGLVVEPCWSALLELLLVVPGGMLLNTLLKVFVDRPRPSLPAPVIELTSSSFPSSHMASATIFYGFLAVVLLQRVRHRGHQMLIMLAAAVLVTLVGVSRLALGVHYLSDVLAAGAVSLAWLALCHAAVETWRRTRVRHGAYRERGDRALTASPEEIPPCS